MKVYVVEAGQYEQTYVEGVYASPQQAMDANPATYEWLPYGDGRWHDAELRPTRGGQYWEQDAVITEYVVLRALATGCS